jgi:hypothetical protein
LAASKRHRREIDIVLLTSRSGQPGNRYAVGSCGQPLPASGRVPTGPDDENVAMESLRQGAQDYLVKGKLDGVLLLRSIRYALERKRIEKTLRESEERFRRRWKIPSWDLHRPNG